MPTLADRVRQRREALGISQSAVAREVGVKQQAVAKIEAGTVERPRFLLELAHALKTTQEWLLDGTGQEEALNGDVDLRTARPAPELDARDRGLPIYASAEGGKDGMVYSTEPIDWMPLPSPLANVRGAFGVYVVGDSMEPRYEHGELILVNPAKPPRLGDDVLLGNPLDGQTRAMVKRLVGRDALRLKLKQWNPPREFHVKRADWPQVMVIVGKYSRG